MVIMHRLRAPLTLPLAALTRGMARTGMARRCLKRPVRHKSRILDSLDIFFKCSVERASSMRPCSGLWAFMWAPRRWRNTTVLVGHVRHRSNRWSQSLIASLRVRFTTWLTGWPCSCSFERAAPLQPVASVHLTSFCARDCERDHCFAQGPVNATTALRQDRNIVRCSLGKSQQLLCWNENRE